MKYYLIAGEASGDLHASRLITSLIKEDSEAEFRFIGGDNMLSAAGDRGTILRHYRDLAYMGFIPVLLHLRTILHGMAECKKDIIAWQPDCVIFVDYAGFNLSIAKYLRKQVNSKLSPLRSQLSTASKLSPLSPQLFYYISPKIWAWKEHRIKNFKRDIDEMFSILPFEKQFFEEKHHYPIHYVGNPTADEVREFKEKSPHPSTLNPPPSFARLSTNFCLRDKSRAQEPVIALLPGSRRQEIKDNLTAMLEAVKGIDGYQFVIAGAPGIEPSYYEQFLAGRENIRIVFGETYRILDNATAALVTSGTATLETACFNVPQVVCYKTPLPKLARWGFNHILKCDYISLVNLIADKEVVQELFADRFSVKNIHDELLAILPGGSRRELMLEDYREVHRRLGDDCAPDNAARIMVGRLTDKPSLHYS